MEHFKLSSQAKKPQVFQESFTEFKFKSRNYEVILRLIENDTSENFKSFKCSRIFIWNCTKDNILNSEYSVTKKNNSKDYIAAFITSKQKKLENFDVKELKIKNPKTLKDVVKFVLNHEIKIQNEI